MFEKEGFCSDGAHAAWLEELRDSYEQMNREDEEVTHGANATTTGIAHKAAYKADLSDTSSIRLAQPTCWLHVGACVLPNHRDALGSRKEQH